VPVDGAGADARAAGDLIQRDAEALRREQLLRGPQDPLAIAARVGATWCALTARFPAIRVVAQDILVDGDKAAVCSTVEGIPAPDGDAQPMLFEIFRIDDGPFAEMWGATTGFPPSASPEELLG
jgi:hypothetical protein